jgi:hypothetical protein
MVCICLLAYGNTRLTNTDTIETIPERVTVFLSSAQVFRSGEIHLQKGTNAIVIQHLSPYIDAKSIRIEAEDDVVIRSVNHTFNYIDDHTWSKKHTDLENQMVRIQDTLKRHHARMDVLEKKEKLLAHNQSMTTVANGLDLVKLSATLELYDEVYTGINVERIMLKDAIVRLQSLEKYLVREKQKRTQVKRKPFSEITVELDSEIERSTTIRCSYLVKEAGWIPRYDIRAENVSSPLRLQYQAQFWQRTRENWHNVMLTFSSATPQNRSTVPELQKWNMNFARLTSYQALTQKLNSNNEINGVVTDESGEPLIGANIVVRGTSIGTITDIDGHFSLADPGKNQILEISYTGYESKNIPVQKLPLMIRLVDGVNLEEITVMGARSNGANFYIDGVGSTTSGISQKRNQTVRGTFVENQTHFSIEVPIPYSISSEGEPINIPLEEYEINASYQYVSIPKLDPYAYLTATINDCNDYHILDGEANLFFENTFVGKTIISTQSFADSTTISLGRDLGVAVSRKKVDEFTRKKFFGNKRIDSRRFDIEIRNNKSEAIKIMVIDQVPVPVNQQITVDIQDLFGGELNEQTGKLKWLKTLSPDESLVAGVAYQVRYPKNETVYLE